MNSRKILVVEDDATLLDIIKYNLKRDEYEVSTAADGAEALEQAWNAKPDLIILDLMLPKLSGLEVCRILRKEMTVPILMLTARNEEIDKVVGLEVGGDDYMTKPFSMRELMARVRAMLRRVEMLSVDSTTGDNIIRINDLEINFARRRAVLAESVLDMTSKEFDLLAFLARNRGIVFNREQILEKVWGYDYAGDTRTVDVHIRWIRGKIEPDPGKPQRIITIRGVGYKLEG